MNKSFSNAFKTVLLCCLLVTYFYIGSNNVYAKTGLDYAKDALWYIIKKASNAYYSKPPTVTYGYNWTQSSTGSIFFNLGTTGASTKIIVYLPDSTYSIEAWANCDAINWTQKISVLLTNKNNNDVINKSITRAQLTYYSPKSSYGNHTLRFVENDVYKWNCYYKVIDHDKQIPPTYQSISNPGTVSSAFSASDRNQVIEYTNDIDGNVYVIPSDREKNLMLKPVLNMEELSKQLYDSSLQTYVDDFKDFDIGDTILFSDKIKDIKYNEENNSTSFTFSSFNGDVVWEFNGDLTNQYQKWDRLNLQFNVVESYSTNDYVFETLDYIQEGLNNYEGERPNIEDYTV